LGIENKQYAHKLEKLIKCTTETDIDKMKNVLKETLIE